MKRGFTLIELLIVIAILSILSAIGVGNFISARTKAKDLSRKSDLQTIAKSLEAYVNDHHTYPLSDGNYRIKCKTDGSICDWGQEFSDGATSGITQTIYATKLPTDPSGYDYHYYSQNGTQYELYAKLENDNDPSITTFNPVVYCGDTNLCNYKISSSNVKTP
jgi:prepilin-type N-terminal cleavage/methylation domain-containing protein